MSIKPIQVNECTCERCGHQWLSRDTKALAKACPKCNSPYWQIPRGKLPQGRRARDSIPA